MALTFRVLSRRKVYSILYSSTLILPSNRRGGGCWGCCCCWLLWERTRSVIITRWKVHGIYSNNLVRTDHVCSYLVTSAAREWIDQSCDDRYLVYQFAAYQHDTDWSYHRLQSVTGIRFTRSIGDCSSSTQGRVSTRWPGSRHFYVLDKQSITIARPCIWPRMGRDWDIDEFHAPPWRTHYKNCDSELKILHPELLLFHARCQMFSCPGLCLSRPKGVEGTKEDQ